MRLEDHKPEQLAALLSAACAMTEGHLYFTPALLVDAAFGLANTCTVEVKAAVARRMMLAARELDRDVGAGMVQ